MNIKNNLKAIDNYTIGNYLGQNSTQVNTSGLIISKSVYNEGQTSNWHFHDNSYLTFILKGGSQEKREHQNFECLPGMLLFYPAKEIHKNNNYTKGSMNLHLEFEDSWYKKFDIKETDFQRESIINNPILKCNLLNAITSLNAFEKFSTINLETSIINVLTSFNNKENKENPSWVKNIYELLHDETNIDWTLQQLASKLNIHPVTISKNFEKYFHENLGNYIRKLKIQKSIFYLSKKSMGLNEVATKSGFVDHAHFSNIFRKHFGITPSHYRTITLG
jgi:AraC family transcriptional regulator